MDTFCALSLCNSMLPAYWWGEKDSNLRRRAPADLQSAPVGHFGISPNSCHSMNLISCSGQLSYIGSSYFWDCKDKSFLKNTKTILKILKLSSDKAVRPGPITAVSGAFILIIRKMTAKSAHSRSQLKDLSSCVFGYRTMKQ